MNLKCASLFAACFFLAGILAGCGSTPTVAPTLAPTGTTAPTVTPLPSLTPTLLPTATPTQALTATPLPTITPVPSPTPTLSPLLASSPLLDAKNGASIQQVALWGRGEIKTQLSLQGGKLVLVSTSEGLTLYLANTLQQVQTFPGALQFYVSDDEKFLAYADQARVGIYDLASQKLYKELPGANILQIAVFSPDNQLLALVHSSTDIEVIRLADLSVFAKLSRARTLQNEPVTTAAAFSPDNQRLLTRENGGLVMWDLAEKKLTWYLRETGHSIFRRPFSPDGRFFLAFDRAGSYLHDSRFGNQLFSALGSPSDAPISPDGRYFYLTNKSVVSVYTLQEFPGVVRVLFKEGPGEVYFTPDSTTLVVASQMVILAEAKVAPLDSALLTKKGTAHITPAQAVQLGNFSNVKGVAAGKQGELWLWGSVDNQVYLWEAVSGKIQTAAIKGLKFLANLEFNAPSLRFAACTDAGLEVLDFKDNTHKLYPACAPSAQVALSPDGTQIARASLTAIDLIDASDGRVLHHMAEHTVNINRLVFSADGKWLAVGTYKNMQNGYCQVSLWQLEEPLRLVPGFRGKLIPGGVNDLAVTPDGQWLVGLTNMIRLWRTSDSEQMKYAGEMLGGQLLALSPDGRLAAISHRGTITLWSVPEMVQVASLSGHPGQVVSLSFTADGSKLISLGQEGTVRLWAVP